MYFKKMATILVATMSMTLVACSSGTITDEQGAAWAEENGYVKADTVSTATASAEPEADETDTVTSATEKKQGGVNYGAIEWDTELQVLAIKEFLKGGTYLGDASFAQDESGYNYREMYQLATIHGDTPANTNLEMVLDASNLHLLGTSEAGTGKTIDFENNPNVSVSWVRQLHVEDEATYNYYCSYGVQYNGYVHIFTVDDLNTEEGKDALINLCDKYYPTLASTWAAYGAGLAELTDEEAIREAKLTYITNSLNRGTMVYYEIVPTSIVITAPFLMNMSPTMANAARFTEVQSGSPKYNYTLGLNESFIDRLVEFKVNYISTDAGKDEVTEYYSSATYQALDGYCEQMGTPTSLELALSTTNAAGLKTQTTYIPE